MQLHEIIQVKGCITQEKYIKGKSPRELERLLGFHKGRLDAGAVIAVLIQLPVPNQFELLGYSQVAEHRFNEDAIKGLSVSTLKELVVRESFTLVGPKRLVKIIPLMNHDRLMSSDLQYPPGLGVPQWKLTSRLSARVVEILHSENAN